VEYLGKVAICHFRNTDTANAHFAFQPVDTTFPAAELAILESL